MALNLLCDPEWRGMTLSVSVRKATVVRGHSVVENGFHQSLDVAFAEDSGADAQAILWTTARSRGAPP